MNPKEITKSPPPPPTTTITTITHTHTHTHTEVAPVQFYSTGRPQIHAGWVPGHCNKASHMDFLVS